MAHMGICPIYTCKPHGGLSPSSKKFLGLSGPYIQVLEARPLIVDIAQENCQEKHDLS